MLLLLDKKVLEELEVVESTVVHEEPIVVSSFSLSVILSCWVFCLEKRDRRMVRSCLR